MTVAFVLFFVLLLTVTLESTWPVRYRGGK